MLEPNSVGLRCRIITQEEGEISYNSNLHCTGKVHFGMNRAMTFSLQLHGNSSQGKGNTLKE